MKYILPFLLLFALRVHADPLTQDLLNRLAILQEAVLHIEQEMAQAKREEFYKPTQLPDEDVYSGGSGRDRKVGVDEASEPGYLGSTSSSGVLRTDGSIEYTDGGDHVTLSVTNYVTVTVTNVMGDAGYVTNHTLGSAVHTDVIITSPVKHQVLTYNGTNWVNDWVRWP